MRLTPIDRPDHGHSSLQTLEKGQGSLFHKAGRGFIKLARVFFLASRKTEASDEIKLPKYPGPHHSKQPLSPERCERMQDYRKRMKENGFVQVRVWVEKQDEDFVKLIARFCRDERQRKQVKRLFKMFHLNQKKEKPYHD